MSDQVPISGELTPAARLLKQSWVFYRARVKIILGIMIIPVLFVVLSNLLTGFLALSDISYSFWFSVIIVFTSFFILLLWFWAALSLLCSFKENTGVIQSYKKSFQKLAPYILVCLLFFIIIMGGWMFFFIFGFLFSVWFGLAVFVFVFEGKKGFSALYRSKQLVSGRFWGVFWRFFVLNFIAGILLFFIGVSAGLLSYFVAAELGTFIVYLVNLFVLPFLLVYGLLIYKNLAEIKSGEPYTEPGKSTRLKYALPALLGAFITGLLVVFFLFNTFWGRDIYPVDDSDLLLTKVEIPEEENAFLLLVRAGEKMEIKYEERGNLFYEMAEGGSWDSEFARELIEDNEEVFELFEQAIRLPYFQIPEFQDPGTIGPETPLPGLRFFRDIARLNLVKANYLLLEGEEQEALDLVIKTLKMGQMIEDMPRPALITYLVGLAVKEIGLQGLQRMIPDLNLSAEVLKDYIIELDQFKENEQGLIRVWKMEYAFITNTMGNLNIAEGLFAPDGGSSFSAAANKLNYFYKPNKTKKEFAEYFRNHIDNTEKDCYQMELVEPEILFRRHPIKILFTENALGELLQEIMMVSFGGFFDQKCSKDFSIMANQLLLALKAFQTENGNLPASLDELVPQYLSELPIDPFEGKPILYSLEEKMIYSPEAGLVFPVEF